MTARIIRFRRPPHVELNGGIVTKSDVPSEVGAMRYFIDLHDEEGDVMGVWDGASYLDAMATLAMFRQDGVRVVDLIGEMRP